MQLDITISIWICEKNIYTTSYCYFMHQILNDKKKQLETNSMKDNNAPELKKEHFFY